MEDRTGHLKVPYLTAPKVIMRSKSASRFYNWPISAVVCKDDCPHP